MRWLVVSSMGVLLGACSAPAIDDRLATDGVKPGATAQKTDAGGSGGGGGGDDSGAKPQTFSLTATLTGSGSGSLSSSPSGVTCTGTTCTGSFPKGTAVTLTAAPAPGSVLIAWSGGCTGTAACAPVLDRDVAIGAELTSLDGTWSGTYTNTRAASGCTFNNAGNLGITATASGAALSHAGTVSGLELRQIPGCALVSTTTGTAPSAAVTVNGTTITGTWTFSVQGASGTLAFPFTAQVTGKTMTGSWTCAGCTGSFSVTKP